jgi:hypothetical protein
MTVGREPLSGLRSVSDHPPNLGGIPPLKATVPPGAALWGLKILKEAT